MNRTSQSSTPKFDSFVFPICLRPLWRLCASTGSAIGALPLSTAALLSTVALIGVAGCDNQSSNRIRKIQANQSANKENRDSIREAFRYLPQLIRVDRTVALREIIIQLNTWSKSVTDAGSWKSSGLLDSVAGQLRTIDFSKRMSRLEFAEPECEYLLQCQMLKDVSKWVVERPYRDVLFSAWLEKQKSSLPADDWSQLESALKLFDWTICNVAIEGQPADAMRLVQNSELPVSNNPSAYQQLPFNDNAPTYRQLPWQTMMFARGDTWERARVFTQLAFLQGIDCVVLALPSQTGATENAALRLWCVAVPIGGEFYLFEPQWGLPIPSQSGEGIATLREAKENPAVLRRARLPGRFDEYPVVQSDLKGLIALMDVEPFALGRTMHTLERSLTGDNRVRLSSDADAIEARLTKLDPTLSVRLWNVPWLAHAYNQSVRERLNEQSAFSLSYVDKFGVFIMDTPISRARNLHFKGQFENTVEVPGALRAYMDVRVDEKTLKDMQYDREIQKSLGVVKNPNETADSFQFRIAQAQDFYRRSKFDVAIFLAMLSWDMGKMDTSKDWLSKRLLQIKGTDRWHAQAHYLMGRAYEQQGNNAAAIAEYEFDNSPQAAGNRIRIRKIQSTPSIANPAGVSASPSADK